MSHFLNFIEDFLCLFHNSFSPLITIVIIIPSIYIVITNYLNLGNIDTFDSIIDNLITDSELGVAISRRLSNFYYYANSKKVRYSLNIAYLSKTMLYVVILFILYILTLLFKGTLLPYLVLIPLIVFSLYHIILPTLRIVSACLFLVVSFQLPMFNKCYWKLALRKTPLGKGFGEDLSVFNQFHRVDIANGFKNK